MRRYCIDINEHIEGDGENRWYCEDCIGKYEKEFSVIDCDNDEYDEGCDDCDWVNNE